MLHVLIIRSLLMYLLHIIYSFDFPLSLPRIYICDIVTGQKYGKKRIYRVAIRSAAYLLRRFSSLSFCLQITPRCIRIVFQSSTIYTRRDHVCFSHGIRGSSTTFQSPTIAPYLLQVRTISAFFSLFLFLFLFYFFFFYFFYALSIFSRSLMVSTAIAVMHASATKGSAFLTKERLVDARVFTRFSRPLSARRVYLHLHLHLSCQRRTPQGRFQAEQVARKV